MNNNINEPDRICNSDEFLIIVYFTRSNDLDFVILKTKIDALKKGKIFFIQLFTFYLR
jgi:hypothetical protein